MDEECATCGTDDELLFTCRYCERHFCDDHQFPHHACDRFSRASRSTTTAPETQEPSGTAPRSRVDESVSTRQTSETEGVSSATAPGEAASPESVGEDHLKGVTAGDPQGRPPGSEPPLRPMDSRRAVGTVENPGDPRTLGDWLRRQTYLTLVVKVGVIAFLINAAFYGGMALTLYGLLRLI